MTLLAVDMWLLSSMTFYEHFDVQYTYDIYGSSNTPLVAIFGNASFLPENHTCL